MGGQNLHEKTSKEIHGMHLLEIQIFIQTLIHLLKHSANMSPHTFTYTTNKVTKQINLQYHLKRFELKTLRITSCIFDTEWISAALVGDSLDHYLWGLVYSFGDTSLLAFIKSINKNKNKKWHKFCFKNQEEYLKIAEEIGAESP